MKIFGTGNVALMSVLLAGVNLSDAAPETLTVSEGDATFMVIRFNDGRDKPFKLEFRQDNISSAYVFNSARFVTNVEIDTEQYEVMYDSSHDLESVELTSSTRRHLIEEATDTAMVQHRRLDFTDCADCEEVWDALCDKGVPSMCDLIDFGSSFSAKAIKSIVKACEIFGNACSRNGAEEICEGQCPDKESSSSIESDSSTDSDSSEDSSTGTEPGSTNSCFDPASEDFKCMFSGDTTITFTECNLVDADTPFLPACFEEFGNTNIERLLLDSNSQVTTYPEGTFAGLSELTFLDLFTNSLETVPEGLFAGLTKLEFLDLRFNGLVTLPEGLLSGLVSLQTLRLFNNELTPESLPLGLFTGVPQLQVLDLGGNRLADLTGLEGIFDGLTELIDLNLGENNLVTVPDGLFAGLTKLEELSFFIGQLTTVPSGLSDLPALRSLDLFDNRVTSLGDSLSGLSELRTLSLEFNAVELPEDVFSTLTNLESLSLSGCDLTTLPVGLFSTLENLVRLSLFENGDLQCVPPNTATTILLDTDDALDGTCVCTPLGAVFCDEGLSCEGGATGYTCVSE